ncbi:BglG family transcription antiterminator [Halalkalibacter sp. APA_J-10(15)]|uniref:BglG family transcription antiterminator n=1 Tax=Halalkalibacter sp. APA_J-10(15) TaxID=2933805 RepID=UPI001FF147F0|nr:BglG family transcription antiterminator [Halalkalibacter sp. APA_J-10(15)]MCK0470104.1 BglG family transcription antiterminator [Halalkalibacter sp. APA_J-10(15)]
MNLLNKREVEILHLLRNSNGYQTGESIALLLEVSSRTIRNDIKQLNVTLEEHGAIVVSRKRLGYELEINKDDLFEPFYEKYVSKGLHVAGNSSTSTGSNVEEEIIRKLLMNCLNDTSITQEELAESLFISLSALKSYLPSIKEIVGKFNLEIISDRHDGMKITGEEDKIRFCLSEYLFNAKSTDVYNDLFPENEIALLKEITLHALLKHHLKLTDVALVNFIIHIDITIKRLLNKRILNYNLKAIERLKDTKELIVVQEIIDEIQSKLNISLQTEVFYITQHLLASSRLSGSSMNTKEYRRIEDMLQDVIVEIKRKTSIDLSEDTKLKEGLILHLSVALKRIEYKMNIRNEVLNSIKNNYPLAFQLAAIASNKINKMTNLRIDENEIGYIAIHFGVALEKKGLNQQGMKKVMIVCGSGIATASLIREKILNYYGHQVSVIETISLAEFKEEMLNQVDMVVSTVPIPHLKSDKLIMINPIISNKDLLIIQNRMRNEASHIDWITYRNIFKEDLFIKNLSLRSRDDVLDYVTTLMEEKNYIDRQTKESIYERENMASTELGNLLAIPHPLDNNMANTAIAVCILNKPITWDKEKVQVIIVLSVSKKEQRRWEVLFKQLYRFLIEDLGIAKLISEYHYHDFLRKLAKYKE